VGDVLKIVALVLPLGLDTFALSTALGLGEITPRDQLRASITFTAFEAIMPVVGFVVGLGVGRTIGVASNDIAGAVLVAVAVYMNWPGRNEASESQRVSLMARSHAAGLMLLGLSISMDELAIGFGMGLLGLPLPLLIGLIAVQALVAAQVGMRLGARIGAEIGEVAERIASLLLCAAAVLIVVG
jgi:putative Mn2+ efflux pump MntP